MASRELAEVLEKLDNIRRATPLTSDDIDLIVKHIKEEPNREKARQTGPAKGQKYWVDRLVSSSPYVYKADDFDLDVCEYRDLYPEERFAQAERRARRLIVGVNKRRRELNEGKEFGDRTYRIAYWPGSGMDVWGQSDQAYARGDAYPFGVFIYSTSCQMCIHEFEGELEWFYTDYMPLMAELDDYDWADAPGWGRGGLNGE